MKIFNALRKRITASAQPCQSASSLPRHSLRMLLALSILLALFAACGDESSSSVSPEPRQCEEQSDDCDNVSSSSEKISKNSSSSQKSANKEKSSSSEKNAKESSSSTTTKNSSSSVDGDKNSSSSAKKEDSSSSAVKASSSSVTPKSSSSEEVKQSSSSVVASSSSVVEESSSSVVKVEYFSPNLSYGEFVDSRNHRVYKYRTITGENADGQSETINVMAENLNIGEMVDGSKDQSDDSKIERYCYDNDTVVCLTYGGLYQWAEAMQLPSECNTKSCADLIKPNHQGICPDGWRLLTYNDFYIVVHADDNDAGVKGVRAKAFGGHNYTGYSLVGAGYLWNHEFEKLNSSTYWFYPEEGTLDQPSALAGLQSKSSTANSNYSTYKTHGFSIRCVMVK
ncbi:MAG: hypothetical protein IK114_10890 [Fibrobacter sp.]|nr:hypothetical protein [Fibrobacter sp.]